MALSQGGQAMCWHGTRGLAATHAQPRSYSWQLRSSAAVPFARLLPERDWLERDDVDFKAGSASVLAQLRQKRPQGQEATPQIQKSEWRSAGYAKSAVCGGWGDKLAEQQNAFIALSRVVLKLGGWHRACHGTARGAAPKGGTVAIGLAQPPARQQAEKVHAADAVSAWVCIVVRRVVAGSSHAQ